MSERRLQIGGSADVALAQSAVPPYRLLVEDSGENTNPRQYEKDNGFYSAVVVYVAAAIPLWTVATDPVRTAGQETTIYSLHIYNPTGAAITAWLEVGGVAITIAYNIATLESVLIDWPAGFDTGDQDIDFNASAATVTAFITGTEA